MQTRLLLALLAVGALVGAAVFAFSQANAEEPKPAAPAVAKASEWDKKTVAVHEWGTFTMLQGSDGSVMDGLTHEERDLPSFVYDLRDFAGVTGASPKMETPVIYFYSPEPRRVQVNVKFPRGAITQWYPAAHDVNHMGGMANGAPGQPKGEEIKELKDGFISWGGCNELLVLPRNTEEGPMPEVKADDPWRFARAVDANLLRNCNLNATRQQAASNGRAMREYERFVFYRGLGNFPLPLQGKVAEERIGADRVTLSLMLANSAPQEPLAQVFIVWVKDGKAGFHFLPEVKDSLTLTNLEISLKPLAEQTEALVQALAAKLTETGLFTLESLAMARTWQHGYFQDEGLRVLYVLPRAFIDRELPLAISGVSAKGGEEAKNDDWKLVRTFVGRTELLTPRQEAEIAGAVLALAKGSAEQRAKAAETLDKWGRFAVPYFNRAKALTQDAEVLAEIGAQLAKHQLRR